jgi:hypothetical protein
MPEPIPPGSAVTATLTTGSFIPHTAATSPFSKCITANGSAASPAPTITSVSPSSSSTVGFTSFRIAGANFRPTAHVFFGNQEIFNARISPNTIDVLAPGGTGTIDVLVRNPDGQQSIAAAAVHYVESCPRVYINLSPDNAAIHSGESVTLEVVASSESTPLTYQWSSGPSAAFLAPIATATNSSIVTQPASSTVYLARVTNACGAVETSGYATVSICRALLITEQPADVTVPVGQQSAVVCLGSSGATSIQWFEGTAGDTTKPITSPSSSPPASTSCIQFQATSSKTVWARLTNGCDSIDTRSIVVSVAAPRRRAVH